jgi:predicted 3-demethylubiquinone-9 3-methyltransferase (glyoxalase superfamily)
MQKVTPFLWFEGQAEEAVNFYVSVFKNSRITQKTYYTGEEPGGTKGAVLTIVFELDGQEFVALNGGARVKFNDAISFVINCDTQQEIDHYWEKLTSGGGEEIQCGWLTDKFGVTWQVVPSELNEWAKNAAGFQRVVRAFMPMTKLDLVKLQAAFDGKGSD